MKKLLFVLSDDFGELVLTRRFILNRQFDTHLLMPEKTLNIFDLEGIEKYLYVNATDILSCINKIKPDVVFLFCGYLLVPNGLIGFKELGDIIKGAQAVGASVATSDPCMRVFDGMNEREDDDFHVEMKDIIWRQSVILSSLPHIYDIPYVSEKVKSLCFKNDSLLFIEEEKSVLQQYAFIISSEDYLIQMKIFGVGFVNLLTQRFMGIVKNPSNRIKVIAPVKLLEAVSARTGRQESISFISYCQYSQFEKIIAKSTAVIYWNVFSASIILCRLYKVPTLFLGKGHMVSIFDELYKHGTVFWYGDELPVFLDLFSQFEIDLDILVKRAMAAGENYLINSKIKRITPEEVVMEIIG